MKNFLSRLKNKLKTLARWSPQSNVAGAFDIPNGLLGLRLDGVATSTDAVGGGGNKLILLFLFICACFYAFMAVNIHNHFQTFGWDLGFFDQLIWKVSRFIYPISSLNKVNILANHFSPILFFFVPLYWLWSDPRMLIIAQAFVVVFAAWPLYLLAFQKTKSKIFSFSVVFAYLFFIGTQWSILNEFHELTVTPFFLSLVFYALEKKRENLFWAGIIGLLIIKEEIVLLTAAIGLTVFLYFKKRKEGILIFVFSLFFFFFLTSFFMPAISEKGAYQHPHLSNIARTPSEFLFKIITDPLFMLKSFMTPPQKISVLIISLLSFGFFPLFASWRVLIPLLEQFLLRFLYTGPQYTFWQNVNHHAAPLSMLLAVSSIYGAACISKKLKFEKKKIFFYLAIVLFLVTFVQDILQKAPVHSLLKRQFYESLSWMEDNKEILEEAQKIPYNESVAAQNSMLPHLSQRVNIYLLPEIQDAEYIVVDLYDGPNKYAPLQYKEIAELINKLINTGEFVVEKKQGEAMLLRRSLPSRP